MPYRRKKKYQRKRPYRRRKKYKKRRGKSSIYGLRVRGVSTMPDMLICKMKYKGIFDVSGPFFVRQTVALNGLYDPDLSATGHQPLGFDQFMNFYEKYEVRASSLLVLITNVSGVTANVSIVPSNDSTGPTSITGMFEAPYSKSFLMAGVEGQPTKVLKSYMTVKKLEGRNINSLNFTGDASNNPSRTLYWHIGAAPFDGSSVMGLDISWQITYYCRLFKRKTLSLS